MTKKIKTIVTGIILALSFTSGVFASKVSYEFVKPGYNVYIDGRLQNIHNTDLIFNYNGRTYIQLNEAKNQLGGFGFEWDNKERSALFWSNEYIIAKELSEKN